MTSRFTQSLSNQTPGFDFVAAHFACEENLYSDTNREGFVNFGSAQNYLQSDQRSDILKAFTVDVEAARYQPFPGTESCRLAVAKYLKESAGLDSDESIEIAASDVVLGNGVISLLEALTIALLDPDDKVLIPTPVFPGLVNAMSLRVRSGVHYLHTKVEEDFRLTAASLEAELQQHSTTERIKAILLCSPGNPIGQVFSEPELKDFLEIAERFDCALIVDEVYAGSCLDGVTFVSALKLQSERVYVLGGLSKDFGLAGFATGWLHVANDAVRKAVAKQSHFYRLPAPILRMTEAVLSDDFQKEFLKSHRSILTNCFQTVIHQLNEHGIQVTPSESGLCLWLDLRAYLDTPDADGEMQLYQSLLNDYRVHVSPGTGFCTPEAGFFRICISQDERTLDEGLARLATGLAARNVGAAVAVTA